jgi:chromosomal replication initiation ATPase DnaA
MAFFFIRRMLRQSLTETGRPFKTDHATVSYWAKKTISLTKHDKVHRAKFIDACHRLGISGETTNDFLNEN